MLKATLNTSAPILAVAGGDLYGIPSSTLGTALLILMAIAVIANQLWMLFNNIRHSIRNPEADFSNLATSPDCGRYRREIGRTLDQLRAVDEKQDEANQKRFDDLDQSIKSMRGEMRDDSKEVNSRLETLTRAVGELIGRTSK